MNFVTGVSPEARVYSLVAGVLLCIWTIHKLRVRSMLVSICVTLILIAVGLVSFAAFPGWFDNTAYLLGVKYPPLLYLVVVCSCLLAIVLHLAERVSAIDMKCRRLTQEIALLNSEREKESLRIG